MSHAFPRAPCDGEAGPCPLVLLSLSGLMTRCNALAEDLASHGYIVVAVVQRDPRRTTFVFDL